MSDATTALAAAEAAAASSQTASDAADFAVEKAVEVNAAKVVAQTAKTDAETARTDAQAAAAAAGAQMWVASEAVTTATVRQAPDGSRIKSTAARTTGATFDATEQGFWTPVLSTAGTLEQVALAATYGRPLAASLSDAAFDTLLAGLADNDRVFLPAGVTLTLNAAHTLTKPVTIDGPGKIVDGRATPTTALFTLGPAASGSKILCRLEGSVGGTYVANHHAVLIQGTDNGAAAAPTYVSDVVIDSPEISGFGSMAVRGEFVQGGSFDIDHAHDLGYAGIIVRSGLNVTSHIRRLTDVTPGVGESYGIQYDRRDASSDLVRYPHSQNCAGRIDVIRDCANMNALGTHGGQGIDLSWGAAHGVKRPLDIVGSTGDGGTTAFAPNNVTFHGGYANSGVTDGTGEACAIIAGAYAAGAVVEYAKGISGRIDTLVGYGKESDSVSSAIYAHTTQGLNIELGNVREPSPYAAHIYHDNIDFVLSIGSVMDPWTNTLATAGHVYVSSTNNTGWVIRSSHTAGSKTATIKNNRGINITGGATNVIRLGIAADFTASTVPINGTISGKWEPPTPTAAGGAGLRLAHGVAPTSPVNGDVWTTTAGMYVRVNGATVGPLGGRLTVQGTLDFPSIAAGAIATLTLTVTGAALGDAVSLGTPSAVAAGLLWSGYVSATDTVTIRLYNSTAAAIDPASATWRATVHK